MAPIGAGDVPGASAVPRSTGGRPLALGGPLLASGAPHGQVAITGAAPGAHARALLIQGAAGGPFSKLTPVEGASAPLALASAYLGDVGLAAPPADGAVAGGLRVHVERFYARAFSRNATVTSTATGPVQALTLALDYRGETLVVWAQGGALYACVIPSTGPARAVQRIAPVAEDPHVAALLSDDNRATVAWSDEQEHRTRVYLDRSAVGERFAAPQLLESFHDPDGLASPTASPSLVRSSTESVLLAWAGAAAGHWVVHSAPVELHGPGAVSTVAPPGHDALLAGLAAGPVDDALLLWTEPFTNQSGTPDTQRQALFAAYEAGASGSDAAFDASEEIAPQGPLTGAQAAFDPDSDRAVAVWWSPEGPIEYSIRASSMTR